MNLLIKDLIIYFSSLYLFSHYSRGGIVFGIIHIPFFVSLFISAIFLTIAGTTTSYISQKIDLNFPKLYKDYVILFFLNSFGLWLLSRFPQVSGLGIAGFWMAIIFGLLVSFVQVISSKKQA